MIEPVEFDRIARHFAPLAGAAGLGLRDDAALLTPPPGRDLVLSADTMVAGVHFFPDDPPDLVARKLLRVNMSDLAAKGAAPLGYLLTVSVPRTTPDSWFAAFAAGLAEDQARFGIALLGGDTTSTPGPVSLSATVIGTVATGAMVRRAGAVPGDGIWVTGRIGDGALGLAVAQGRLADPDGRLLRRYRLPDPRLGLVSPAFAHAAMDISDGLVQDLRHLCRASGCGAVIEAGQVPRADLGPEWLETCLTGGDDYELLCAVPPACEAGLLERALACDIPVARIGTCVTGSAVTVMRDGIALTLGRGGFSHF